MALHYDFPHGGWCPKGRRSLDGPIPAKYQLAETSSASYPQRTEWNVRDSDGTVVFTFAKEPTGGSLKTVQLAKNPAFQNHRIYARIPKKMKKMLATNLRKMKNKVL